MLGKVYIILAKRALGWCHLGNIW